VWNLIESWTGTVRAPAAWHLIETWTGTVRAPAAWNLIESWTGTVRAPTAWNLIESWTGTVKAPVVTWQLIETWTGTVEAPVAWQLIETWTGTIQAPAAWQLIETWTGTVEAPVVAVPDFTVSVSPMSDSVQQGDWTTATVTVTSENGYNLTVSLTASGQPSGVLLNFSPSSGVPTFSSTLLISVGSDSQVGVHEITITGTGADDKVRTSTYTLTITAPPAPPPPPPPGVPVSKVDAIIPYWQVSTPFTITATALDPDGSVERVELLYQYSGDYLSWTEWTSWGTDISSPWEWSFNAPAGDGFYEFYSIATDDDGNVEAAPDIADARCRVDTIAPPAPELITPLDRARMEDNTLTFDWSDVTDPSGVTYELTIEIYGSPVLTKTRLTVSAYTLKAGEALPEGTYNWHVRAVDEAGNAGDWFAARSFTIEIIAPPTVVIPEIPAGETQTADFGRYNLFATEVTITALRDISDAEISIKESIERPAWVSEPPGIVYPCFAIITTNIESSDISSVALQFQLSRLWVEQNEIDEGTIKILRFGSEWNPLPTTLIGGDENFLYFEAVASGFSVFVTTGEKRAPPLPPPVPAPVAPIVFYALISLGVTLGGSALAYRLYRLKRKPPKPIRKPYLMLKRLEEAVVKPRKRRIRKPLAKPEIIEKPPKPIRKPYLMLKELEEAVVKPRERRVRKPLVKPKVTSFLINRDAKTTSSRKATLSIAVSKGVSDVVQMRFSDDKRSWSAWKPFSKSKAHTLPARDGPKTIYIRVKDKAGLISPIVSASIKLRIRRVAKRRVPTEAGYSIEELRRIEAKLRRY